MCRVCMGRLGNGPSLQWAEFAVGRDVQLPVNTVKHRQSSPNGVPLISEYWDTQMYYD